MLSSKIGLFRQEQYFRFRFLFIRGVVPKQIQTDELDLDLDLRLARLEIKSYSVQDFYRTFNVVHLQVSVNSSLIDSAREVEIIW